MTLVRLGLIGFGRWGRNYVKAAEDSGEAAVTSVTVRNQSEVTAREILLHGVPQLPSMSDAVVFAGHPSDAARCCEHALALGLPILCEKPAGLSLADAERIVAAEAKSKAFVLVGHQHLFAEGFEELRSLGQPAMSWASWTGPAVHDFPMTWDYGAHAAACTLALGARVPCWIVMQGEKAATVSCVYDDMEGQITYDAYASQAEPPLTRQVRAFAKAVRAGGTDDYRFGAKWAVDVARVLSAGHAVSDG